MENPDIKNGVETKLQEFPAMLSKGDRFISQNSEWVEVRGTENDSVRFVYGKGSCQDGGNEISYDAFVEFIRKGRYKSEKEVVNEKKKREERGITDAITKKKGGKILREDDLFGSGDGKETKTRKNTKEGLNLSSGDEGTDPARAGALHTLYKLGKSKDSTLADLIPDEVVKEEGGNRSIDYDLDNPDPEKKKKIDAAMEARFNELSRKLWDLLVVHGYAEKQEDGTFKMTKEISDLDGESCLILCRMAGFDNARIKYVPQGTGENEEGLVMDTFSEEGLSGVLAKDGGKTVGIDHHGKESGRDTSAAKHTYEFLIENGLLKKEDYLDDYVKFVTQEDNKDYSELTINPEERFRNSWRTLRGLRNYFDPKDMIELFKKTREDGGVFDPDKPLADDFLESYKFKARTDDSYELKNNGKTLKELGELAKGRIERTEKAIQRLEKNGFVFDTGEENYGKIIIDSGEMVKGKRIKEIPLGHDAAMIFGYDTLLNWDPKGNGMVIYTKKPFGDIRFPQGFNVRGNMWMKPKSDPAVLQITLEEIFSKLSRKRVRVPESLKEALKKKTLEKVLVDAPDGVDVLKNHEGDSAFNAEAEKEREIDPERWEWMQMLIKEYVRGGAEWLSLLKGGRLFSAPKNLEEEKKEVEKFVRDGLARYNNERSAKDKFDEEELEYIFFETMKQIFS